MITDFSGIFSLATIEGGVGWLISLNLLAREKEEGNNYFRTVQVQLNVGLTEKTADWLKRKGR